MTLTLAKELCGFDLLFDEGRLDLVNSSCHLPSDSSCNLDCLRALLSTKVSALTLEPARDSGSVYHVSQREE